jgi:hypothetical protein
LVEAGRQNAGRDQRFESFTDAPENLGENVLYGHVFSV